MIRRVLYACSHDPLDVEVWSGSVYNIYLALLNTFEYVEPFGPLNRKVPMFEKVQWSLLRKATGHYPIYTHLEANVQQMGRKVDQKVRDGGFDAVFAPSTPVISAVTADVPLFAFHDATIQSWLKLYWSDQPVHPKSFKTAIEVERRALTNSARMFYTSQWACDQAMQEYDLPAERFRVVPFGANMECLPPGEVEEVLDKRSEDGILRLLFIGKEWERKGGDIAAEAVRLLVKAGIQAELHLVGTEPKLDLSANPHVISHGYISKRTPEGMAKLQSLLRKCDLFLLPTRAECYGVVFCEASGYAMPSIASRTGGVPTAIEEGENGYLLELSDGPEEYAELIQRLLADQAGFRKLSESSYARYRNVLNWESCGQSLKREIETAVCERTHAK